MSTIVVGVDPGLDGAIALYRPGIAPLLSFEGVEVPRPELMLWDMPTHTVQAGKGKTKREVDIRELCALAIYLVGVYGAQRVIIEKVSGMPGQGSGFSFGWNTAAVMTAFIAAGAHPEQVTPAMWKKQCDVPADKKLATGCAELTFPNFKHLFHVPHKTSKKGVMVPRHDRSEAALLAWWGVEVS